MSEASQGRHARIEVILPDGPANLLARVVHSRRIFQPKLQIRHLDVIIEGMAESLQGFTIAQVSDLHIGPGDWGPMRVEEASVAIRRVAPDVVVNTGDFVQGEPPLEQVTDIARRLLIEGHRNNCGPANVAILGNHDYFQGNEYARELTCALRNSGIAVLHNETAEIKRGSGVVTIAGLSRREPGLDDGVEALRKSPGPRIALAHEADLAEGVAEGGFDLLLAGHTHGGQIVLPMLRAATVKFFNGSKYLDGEYFVNGNRVYINRGLGCTGLPIRFRAAPELTFFHLSR